MLHQFLEWILKYVDLIELLQTNCTTLPDTNSSHLKMDGWNTIVSFWDVSAYFQV